MTGNIRVLIGTEMIPFGSTEDATAYLMRLNKAPKNQKKFVREHLVKYKTISRNFALSHYITKLATIVSTLKADGFEIGGDFGDNGIDFIYTLQDAKLFA